MPMATLARQSRCSRARSRSDLRRKAKADRSRSSRIFHAAPQLRSRQLFILLPDSFAARGQPWHLLGHRLRRRGVMFAGLGAQLCASENVSSICGSLPGAQFCAPLSFLTVLSATRITSAIALFESPSRASSAINVPQFVAAINAPIDEIADVLGVDGLASLHIEFTRVEQKPSAINHAVANDDFMPSLPTSAR